MRLVSFFLLNVVLTLTMEAMNYSDLPMATNDGLRLSVEVSRTITSIPPSGVVEEGAGQKPSSIINVNAFIMNASNTESFFLLGNSNSVRQLQGGKVILYSSNYWNGFDDGKKIKPRIDDYRPIMLRPGEIAQLPTVTVFEESQIDNIQISYLIPAIFSEYDNKIWTGRVSVGVTVPTK